MRGFATASLGLETRAGRTAVPRHRHAHGYAAVVLRGGYEEAGDEGRRRVSAGSVLFHNPFDAHLDRFDAGGAEILNLALPYAESFPLAGRVEDADSVMRAAERDPEQALALLLAQIRPEVGVQQDWPDLLAADLAEGKDVNLGEWARAHGLAPATVSRGFRTLYGVPPARYRVEMRARRALRLVTAGAIPLAEAAQASGFCDQAHMTRAVSCLTGQTPAAWRRSNLFKTARRAAA